VLLASGAGSVAQSLFDSVTDRAGALHGRITIIEVISDNPRAGILERAAKSGFPTRVIAFSEYAARAAWEQELAAQVAKHDPWLVVSAGFMKILSPNFVNRFRIINTHPSLLPSFPGSHAVRDALAAGVHETGCTLHFVDAGVDTGQIIAQRRLEILFQESEEQLHERIKVLERELLVTGILGLLQGGN
jgi:phosphoribosylglycinamide formyltransferase-1